MSSRAKRKKTTGPSFDDEVPIWEYIYENTCNMELYDEVGTPLFKQYLDENKELVSWSVEQLEEYYTTSMKSSLYKCDLPAKKMLSLYKTLEIEIPPHVEVILETRFVAILCIDSGRRLQKFTIFSSGKNQASSKSPSKSPPKTAESPENRRKKQRPHRVPLDLKISESFERSIWNHIHLNGPRVNGQLLMSEDFWSEMLQNLPEVPIQSAHCVLHHFNSRMLETLWKQALDPSLKLRIIKDLCVPMSERQQKWMRDKNSVDVRLSKDGYVESYHVIEEEEESEETLTTSPKRNITTWIPRTVSGPNVATTSKSVAPRPVVHYSTPSRPPPIFKHRQPSTTTNTTPPRQVQRQPSTTTTTTTTPRRQPSTTTTTRKQPSRSATKPTISYRQRIPFSVDDQIYAWKYIYNKISDAKRLKLLPVLPKGLAFWTQFVRSTSSRKNAANWSSHFRKQMCPTLYEMPLPRDVILYLYQNIEIDVDTRIREILERKCNAKLQIGLDLRLISWKFLDGSADGIRINTDPYQLNEEEEEEEGEEENQEEDEELPSTDPDVQESDDVATTTQPIQNSDEQLITLMEIDDDDDDETDSELGESMEIEEIEPSTAEKSIISPIFEQKVQKNRGNLTILKENTPKIVAKPRKSMEKTPAGFRKPAENTPKIVIKSERPPSNLHQNELENVENQSKIPENREKSIILEENELEKAENARISLENRSKTVIKSERPSSKLHQNELENVEKSTISAENQSKNPENPSISRENREKTIIFGENELENVENSTKTPENSSNLHQNEPENGENRRKSIIMGENAEKSSISVENQSKTPENREKSIILEENELENAENMENLTISAAEKSGNTAFFESETENSALFQSNITENREKSIILDENELESAGNSQDSVEIVDPENAENRSNLPENDPEKSINSTISMENEENEEETTFHFEPPYEIEGTGIAGLADPESQSRDVFGAITDTFDMDSPSSPVPRHSPRHQNDENSGENPEIFDLDSIEEDEFMTHDQLMNSIEKIVDEAEDGAIDTLNEEIQKAFRKENWDEDSKSESRAYHMVTTVIENNTNEIIHDVCMEKRQELINMTMVHVENQLVFDVRLEQFEQVLEETLKNPKLLNELAPREFQRHE